MKSLEPSRAEAKVAVQQVEISVASVEARSFYVCEAGVVSCCSVPRTGWHVGQCTRTAGMVGYLSTTGLSQIWITFLSETITCSRHELVVCNVKQHLFMVGLVLVVNNVVWFLVDGMVWFYDSLPLSEQAPHHFQTSSHTLS